MKNILTICFPMLMNYCATTQSVISLYTQAGVDTFPVLFDTTEIVGSLIIGYPSGDQLSDIHDLTPLSSIKKVYGNFRMRNNPHLKTLHGLHNIDSIFSNAEVSIINNDSLVDLAGLSSLAYAGDGYIGFRIQDNEQLVSLDGLENIIRMDDVPLIIQDNPQLHDLGALENLIACKSLLLARNNLQSLDLPSLINIHYNLRLWEENNLESLNGLTALDTIGRIFNNSFRQGKLDIWSCENLKNVDGLENLYMTDFSVIRFWENNALENIDALTSMTTDTATIVEIEDNPKLISVSLNEIKDIRHRIKIINNEQLTSISFPQLTYVDGDDVPGFSDMYDEDLHEPDDFWSYGIHIENNTELQTIDMPLLNRLEGDLRILNNPNLASLEGFSNLELINRHLTAIFLDNLESFSGLEKLRWVGGDLNIGLSPNVTEFCDFIALDSVRRRVSIGNMPLLNNINSLNTLSKIGSGIALINLGVEDISFINSIDSIGWDFLPFQYPSLYLETCPNLASFELYSTVDITPYCYLNIKNNNNLQIANWDGINQLSALFIEDNPNIFSIDFPTLTEIGYLGYPNLRHLKTKNNLSLESIDGLANLQHIQDSLVFANNPLLTDCEAICHIRDAGVAASKIKLYGNDFPCNTLADIELHICDSLTAVFTPEKEKAAEILAYPNPANTEFRVSVPLQYLPSNLLIYDATGREVQQVYLQNSHQLLEMNDWQCGVYYLYLEKAEAWGKVVKME